ncbi:MAG: hypothetical protein WC529_08710 [Candidatus Margulisiibacteriota bacterium]
MNIPKTGPGYSLKFIVGRTIVLPNKKMAPGQHLRADLAKNEPAIRGARFTFSGDTLNIRAILLDHPAGQTKLRLAPSLEFASPAGGLTIVALDRLNINWYGKLNDAINFRRYYLGLAAGDNCYALRDLVGIKLALVEPLGQGSYHELWRVSYHKENGRWG